MMEFLKSNGKCPYCNKSVQLIYNENVRYNGSPVRMCKKCGQRYCDTRYHELAVEGIPNGTFSYWGGIISAVIGGLIAYRGIYLIGWKTLGSSGNFDWIKSAIFLILGIAMIIFGIVDMICVFTGKKQERYDKILSESDERMRDRSYAYLLKELGYNVPEKYL